MKKVVVSSDPNACWGWTASLNDHGYGRIRINNIEYVASRLAYAVHYKHDPDHLDVCHTCNNPKCTNPRHLKLGTHLENMQYAVQSGRRIGGPGVPRNRGEANPMSKLTDADIKKILEEYATGAISQKALGLKYGVRQGHISNIITRARRGTVDSGARDVLAGRYGT